MNKHLELLLRLTRPLPLSEAERWAIEAGAGRENASSDDPLFLQEIQAYKRGSLATTARRNAPVDHEGPIRLPGTSAAT